jgi:hypothetical protein
MASLLARRTVERRFGPPGGAWPCADFSDTATGDSAGVEEPTCFSLIARGDQRQADGAVSRITARFRSLVAMNAKDVAGVESIDPGPCGPGSKVWLTAE